MGRASSAAPRGSSVEAYVTCVGGGTAVNVTTAPSYGLAGTSGMPVASASAAAYGAAASVPSAAAPTSGVIVAATTAHTAALGPSASYRDVPKIGYMSNAANAV